MLITRTTFSKEKQVYVISRFVNAYLGHNDVIIKQLKWIDLSSVNNYNSSNSLGLSLYPSPSALRLRLYPLPLILIVGMCVQAQTFWQLYFSQMPVTAYSI